MDIYHKLHAKELSYNGSQTSVKELKLVPVNSLKKKTKHKINFCVRELGKTFLEMT